MLKKLALSFVVATICATPTVALAYEHVVVDVLVEPDFKCNDDLSECETFFSYSILPKEDDVIVKSVKVNNGRCPVLDETYFNSVLTEEDYAEFNIKTDDKMRHCRPRIVEVTTNKGTNTFSLNNE